MAAATFDPSSLTQLFVRYFNNELKADTYLVSLCSEPTQESTADRICVSARYVRNGRHFSLEGIRQPGDTQFLHPLRLMPDIKTQALHPIVAPEFKQIEETILRQAWQAAEDRLSVLSNISILDESVIMTPQECQSGTHDLVFQFLLQGQMISSRIFCGRNDVVSLFFSVELPDPRQDDVRIYPTSFTFSDEEHMQRLPLDVCQE